MTIRHNLLQRYLNQHMPLELKDDAEVPDSWEGTEVPEALRDGAPVPKTWPYGQEAWQSLAAKAREHLTLKPWFDFAHAIAVLGFYPEELATGQLRPGAQIKAMTGAVVRPPKPTIPRATEDRARDALRALAERNVKIDPLLHYNLELAAYGRYLSHPRGADAAIAAAESAVQQDEAQRRAAAKQAAERPWLVVHFAFRGPGGRSFDGGRERVDPGLAEELCQWQERMEAQAKQHGWDAPSGYSPSNWPPFSIEEVDA